MTVAAASEVTVCPGSKGKDSQQPETRIVLFSVFFFGVFSRQDRAMSTRNNERKSLSFLKRLFLACSLVVATSVLLHSVWPGLPRILSFKSSRNRSTAKGINMCGIFKHDTLNVTSDQPRNVYLGAFRREASDESLHVTSGQPLNVVSDQPENVTSGKPQNVTSDKPRNATSNRPQNATSSRPQNATSSRPHNVTLEKLHHTTSDKSQHVASHKPESPATADPSLRSISQTVDATPVKRGNVTPNRNSGHVNVFVSSEKSCKHFLPLVVPRRGPTRICTYDPDDDLVISGTIKRTCCWEWKEVNAMINIMDSDVKNMASEANRARISLVDVGCNIGVFTLSAALAGYDVLAIDAMNSSLQLLATSIRLAGLRSRVMLINNAISHKYETVHLQVGDPNNFGGSTVLRKRSGRPVNADTKRVAQTICMDNLVQFVHTRRVFLKMDIEQSEFYAFQSADRFFAEVDVRYILMEWAHYASYRNRRKGVLIIKYLTKKGYRPYSGIEPSQALQASEDFSWPTNVLWKKI
ncbi:hypothetical protein BaRGS_00005559 [Batillaria attramentaria]|uniref:Methyltransferase FkbM domain-containing protein n=1 Tax=Batillaria attramentaria TaxID=370345 RepID=A0ABD0LUM5_9CAEN